MVKIYLLTLIVYFLPGKALSQAGDFNDRLPVSVLENIIDEYSNNFIMISSDPNSIYKNLDSKSNFSFILMKDKNIKSYFKELNQTSSRYLFLDISEQFFKSNHLRSALVAAYRQQISSIVFNSSVESTEFRGAMYFIYKVDETPCYKVTSNRRLKRSVKPNVNLGGVVCE